MTAGRVAILLAALLGCGAPRSSDFDLMSAGPYDRGRYLVLHVSACVSCHSVVDWKQEGFPPREGAAAAGRAPFSEGTPSLTASNLTPDRETGAGRWSDEQYEQAIRRGVGADGRLLHPAM